MIALPTAAFVSLLSRKPPYPVFTGDEQLRQRKTTEKSERDKYE